MTCLANPFQKAGNEKHRQCLMITNLLLSLQGPVWMPRGSGKRLNRLLGSSRVPLLDALFDTILQTNLYQIPTVIERSMVNTKH